VNSCRIDLDNNPVERAIRPVALGRKKHLFAGSDGGGARWAKSAPLLQQQSSTTSSRSPTSKISLDA